MWIDVLHHVCGEHEWVDAANVTEWVPKRRQSMQNDLKAYKDMREMLLNKLWLKNLKFLSKFQVSAPW